MKRYLLTVLMILAMAVSIAGCGSHKEETPDETDALTEAVTVEIETESSSDTAAASAAVETEESETTTTEESSSDTTAAVITEAEAEKLLIKEFGEVDEGSGDKNIFIYEKVINVDGVDYYSYKGEAGDGSYLCDAFVRTDGTDALTGIYSDGKWELGSDFGSDDPDDSFDDGMEYDEEEYDEEYDDSEDDFYDDGFEDVDEEGEEPAEDDVFDDMDPEE